MPSAAAEDTWDLSLAGFGGWALTDSADIELKQPFPFLEGEAQGVTLDNSFTAGAKLTAWWVKLPFSERIDFGLELDVTRFTTEQMPQTADAEFPGDVVGFITFPMGFDIKSHVAAVNLLWRYPVSVSDALPHGRWYPYFGVGGGASLSQMRMKGGPWRSNAAPVLQGVAGVKVFLTRSVGIFAEYKRTQTSHDFRFQSFDLNVSLGVNHFVGGLAFHF